MTKQILLIESKKLADTLEQWLLKQISGCTIIKVSHEQEAMQILNKQDVDLVVFAPELYKKRIPHEIPIEIDIVSQTHHGIQRVPLQDVYYFKAEHKYILVNHQKGELLIEGVLTNLAEKYADWFVQTHRSFLVRKSEIQGMLKAKDNGHFLILKHVNIKLPVSRRQLPRIRQLLKG